MEITRAKILGSTYVGLFTIANDKLCFVPAQIEKRVEDEIAKILDVKTVRTTIYGSALLAVFSKMNNKTIFLPSFVSPREVEEIEKEIKVKLISTEGALGNLMEINDTCGVASKALGEKAIAEIRKEGIKIEQMNIARTDVVGSAMVLTNKGFLVGPNTSKEEAMKLKEVLKIKGGSASANMGDAFVRNSILANSKGLVLGENTTPFEIARIEEALE